MSFRTWLLGPPDPPKRQLRIVVWHPKNDSKHHMGVPHLRLVSRENGKIMFSSETFDSEANAVRAATTFADLTGWEVVHEGPGHVVPVEQV